MTTRPSPFQLWEQAGREHADYEPRAERFRELMREHGHLVPRRPTAAEQPTVDRLAARCIHDLPTITCADCRPPGVIVCARRSPRPAPTSDAQRTVHARYPGRCADCGERYPEGEPIQFGDAAGGWVASCCS